MAQGGTPSPFGDGEAEDAHGEEEERPLEGGRGFDEDAGGDVGDEEHWDGEGEDGFEEAAEGFVGHASDVEEVVVAPNNALSANGPEADGREKKHQRVMDDDAHDAKDEEAEDVERCRKG